MVDILQRHVKDINRFDKDRVYWLRLSGFVFITIIAIIIDLALFKLEGFHWFIVSAGLTLAVCWWYWTMKLIRKLLDHRLAEVEILTDIVKDIQLIKEDVKKLDHSS